MCVYACVSVCVRVCVCMRDWRGYDSGSAIFWLRCEPMCTFTKALTLVIDHCAKSENVSKLCFVRAVCTQPSLPYTFKRLDSGKFSRYSSCGAIELSRFSGVAISQEGAEEREYCAMLYYLGKDFVLSYEFDIHFVITPRQQKLKHH